jgi:anti-anti-sigma regulatory factor
MPSHLLIGHLPNAVVLRIVGRGTMQESLAFRAAAASNLDRGTIIFDAAQCDHLDSTFLGCLIGVKKACEASACRFLIRASDATRVKLFSTSSLDRFFDFTDTCPDPSGELQSVDIDKLDPMTLGRHSMRCHEHLAERGGREADAFRSVADCLRKEIGEDATEP